MSLSDPNAPAYALAVANLLRGMPNTGKVLSGTYWASGYLGSGGSVTTPTVRSDFNDTFLGLYQKAGAFSSSGFPYIMGIYAYVSHRGSWEVIYPLTAIPHARAGGLVAIIHNPFPNYDYESNGGSFGTNGWPVMGTGDTDGPNWYQGLATTTASFTIDSTFASGTGQIPASLSTSHVQFPSSGYLWVQTKKGYAIVSYGGLSSTAFTNCTCSVTGSLVNLGASVVDYALLIPGTRQNGGINFMLDDLNASLVLLDSFQIAPILRILSEPENSDSIGFWYAGLPTPYYQALWSYYFNYVTGVAASIPIAGADGSYTTTSQPVVANNPTGTPPTYPIHNALWTFSQIGDTGTYGRGYLSPPVGQVDVIGLDYYATDLTKFNTAIWPKIRNRYGTNIILGLTEMGQLGSTAEPATSWENAWQLTNPPPNAFGPSFFISWSEGDNFLTGSTNLYNFGDQIGAPAVWNGGLLKNLKPGAWALTPQQAGNLEGTLF